MSKEDSFSWFKIIFTLIQTYLTRISDIAELAGLEAKLARKALVYIFIFYVVFACLFVVCLLSINTLGFILLFAWKHNLLYASAIVSTTNIFLLLTVWLIIVRNKKNLSFSATRRQLSKLVDLTDFFSVKKRSRANGKSKKRNKENTK